MSPEQKQPSTNLQQEEIPQKVRMAALFTIADGLSLLRSSYKEDKLLETSCVVSLLIATELFGIDFEELKAAREKELAINKD